MKGVRFALGIGLAALFTLPLQRLWSATPYGSLAPPSLLGLPTGLALALVVGVLAFVAIAQSRTSPLPWLAMLAGALLVPVLYPYTTIDWTRLLKDWGLLAPRIPPALALAYAIAPFVVAFAAHAIDHRERLAARLARKGVPAAEQDAARSLLARRAATATLAAVAATLALGAAFLALQPAAQRFATWPLPFAAPVLAALVLAALAWGFLRGAPAT